MKQVIGNTDKALERLKETLHLPDFINLINEDAALDDEVWNKDVPDAKYSRWYSTGSIAGRLNTLTTEIRRDFTMLESFGWVTARRTRNRIYWSPVNIEGFKLHPKDPFYLARINDGIDN